MITWDQALQDCQDFSGDTTAAALAFFKRLMNNGYKLILADLNRPNTERTVTANTRAPSTPLVDSDRVYQMPPDFLWLKSIQITVGGQKYPLVEEEAQEMWDFRTRVNTTGIPSTYFIRPRFGVAGAEILLDPIPTAASQPLTLVYEATDADLTAIQVDNTTNPATLTFTQGSASLTSNNSIFSTAMVGRYVYNPDGDGLWYKIVAYVSGTQVTLENYYQATTSSTTNWTINQIFNLPEEMQILPVYFALWHYFFTKKDTSGKIGEYKTLYDDGMTAGKARWGTKSRGNIIRNKRYYRQLAYPGYFPIAGISS